jgi:8-oxo-dGTP pyrophosphatase MutT (NUDIX family)
MKKAVCVLFKVGKDYLAVTRPKSDLIGLVGGKVDPGENELQAIVREVEEEVGLSLDPSLFKEVLTLVCPGEVSYLTTAFTFPDLSHDHWLGLDPEEGLSVRLVTKEELCDEACSPFAEYNRKLFDVVEAAN